MYSFPVWRRAPFIALLIVTLVIAYSPATTQGTATVRLTARPFSSAVSHIYVAVGTLALHTDGLPNSTGWVTISQTFPTVDLLSVSNQSVAQTIASTTVHSGRYDALRIVFTNSTLVISGVRRTVAAPSPVSVNATLLLSPSGVSDTLLDVAIDYSAIFATTPSLSLLLVAESFA